MHLSDLNAPIFVAGHRGLVGRAVVRELERAGYTNLLLHGRDDVDLCDQRAVRAFFEARRPQFVVLAAAKVGGIQANATYPADFLAENLAIALNVVQAAHDVGVGARGRLVFLGSSCIYPREAPQPMREEHLLTGTLETTNEAYAVAKIAGLKLAEAFHRQHGDDAISLTPTNLYGPGDSFDPMLSHVLPALIRKFHEAKVSGARTVTLWGSGAPRREFLHADDLAGAVRFVLEQPEARLREVAPDGLLNVGVGEDLAIRELALLVQDVVGGEVELAFDATKPDGTPRKWLDVSRMNALGWQARTSLRDGVAATYRWYLDHVVKAVPAAA